MKLTVKDLKQNSHEIDNIEISDTIESLCVKVKELYGYTDGVRLIYCGRVLDKNKNISDYFNENSTGFIVCMPEKKPNQPVSQPTSQPTSQSFNAPIHAQTYVPIQQTPMLTQQTQVPTQQIQNNNLYTREQVRALIVIFTQFIQTSPDVFHIYCTNQREFQNFLLSNDFMTTILNPMLASASQVVDAINNHQNIDIQIPVVANLNNRNNNRQNNNSNSNNSNNSYTEIINNLEQNSDQEPEADMEENMIDNNTSQTTNLTNLNETDNNNIDELMQLGFTKEIATRAYLMSGKNKEIAASVLFEFI